MIETPPLTQWAEEYARCLQWFARGACLHLCARADAQTGGPEGALSAFRGCRVAFVRSPALLEGAGSPLRTPPSIVYLFAIATLVHGACWMALWAGLRSAAARPPERGALPPISVIVAARNEAERLPALLAALQNQTHDGVEVVIADDNSSDATPILLERWRRRIPGLRVVRRDDDAAGGNKKRALQAGIAAASHALLAFTDADCEPPPQWLETLARIHASSKRPTVLVGYSPFRSSGHSVLALAARYETFLTGVLTAGAAGLGLPYMAVGRNLSYPSSVFDAVEGFRPIMHSLSGDDDLFVQEVVRRSAADVRAVTDAASFVPTRVPATWKAWLRQKRRHASAGRFYSTRSKAALALFHGSNAIVWIAPLFLGWLGAALLGIRLAVQFAALRSAARRLGEETLLPVQPLMEALYLLYTTLAAPSAMLFAPRRW